MNGSDDFDLCDFDPRDLAGALADTRRQLRDLAGLTLRLAARAKTETAMTASFKDRFDKLEADVDAAHDHARKTLDARGADKAERVEAHAAFDHLEDKIRALTETVRAGHESLETPGEHATDEHAHDDSVHDDFVHADTSGTYAAG